MRSPFPGMDPFVEGQDSEDFHTGFIAELAAALVPRIRPKYVARKERRIHVELMPEERRESFLTLRDRQTMEVVTVIELFSPANKRPGGDGRR